ncbi:hypothetical protein [Mucilaginibacter straminoryzae]|nr:hypothetical protein [Mucilaginibacter straminoryzae]
MTGWITVHIQKDGVSAPTLVNLRNVTHIKNIGGTGNGGKTHIFFNTATADNQRVINCAEDLETVMRLIREAC